MTLSIGTTGWLHPQWRGGFYPLDLPAGEWARYYAEQFDAIEVPGRLVAPRGALAARVWTDCPRVVLNSIGPVLLRLTSAVPARRAFVMGVLDDIPESLAVAVELVGDEWHRRDVTTWLSRRGCVPCWSDRRPHWLDRPRRTADWYYLRFYRPLAAGEATRWTQAIAATYGADATGYAFFTDPQTALAEAVRFADAAAAAGLHPSRVPGRSPAGLVPS